MTMTDIPASSAVRKDREIRLGQRRRMMMSKAIKTLNTIEPETEMGRLALQMVAQSSVSVLSVAAISGYVYALREAALPNVTFRGTPPGPGIDNAELQAAYNQFQTQFATFQGQAGAWINTQQGSGAPSIFSQLVSVPTTFQTINQSVLGKFTILKAETPGSSAYDQTLDQLKSLIGAELPDIQSLKQSMITLGTNLETAAETLQTAATTGVLQQLIAAYQSEIDALNQDIQNCNDKIDSDNSKIIGLGFAAAAAITVGLIGLVNFWNPIGWIMIAGGAVGAYFAIAEIELLKGEIATLKAQIQNDEAWRQADQSAAASVSAFAKQVGGFASMNAAAQQELTQLETLYQTLADDVNTAISELDSGNLDQAEDEWNTIVGAAAVLQNLSAYIWPTSIMLPHPTSFSPTGSDVYAIDMAGQVFHYSEGGNTWSELPETALSVVAAGSIVVGIDGAPIDGSESTPTPVDSTYNVKTYDASSNAWTTISTFPAAAVTTDGTTIYAINQTMSDRQVYQYSGSGQAWTALPAMPNTDAPSQIAVAGSKLFALSTNSQQVYVYENGGWETINSSLCVSINGNGDYLSFVDSDLYCYVYDVGTGQLINDGNTGSSISQVAQMTTCDQYIISSDPALELYAIDNTVNPSASTALQPNATGCFVSDTDVVYYTDNEGNTWRLNSQAGPNSWTQLPDLPQG